MPAGVGVVIGAEGVARSRVRWLRRGGSGRRSRRGSGGRGCRRSRSRRASSSRACVVAGDDGGGGAVDGGDGDPRPGAVSVGRPRGGEGEGGHGAGPAMAVRAWLRRATMRAASSRVRAPAMWAAAISPWEWPMTASGVTPRCCQSRARATMTANRAGWTTSTRGRGRPSAPARTSSEVPVGVGGAGPRRRRSSGRRRPARCRSSSTPMPAHWEPWPGKTNDGLAGSAAASGPTACRVVRRRGQRGQGVSQFRRGPWPTTTARWSKWARLVARDERRCRRGVGSSGWSVDEGGAAGRGLGAQCLRRCRRTAATAAPARRTCSSGSTSVGAACAALLRG